MAMTPAMATRCFCPPESRWGACSRTPTCPPPSGRRPPGGGSPPGGTPRFSGAKATSSSTTVATIWLSGFWNTMPTVRRMSSSLSSSAVSMPSTYTLPPVGSSMALKCLARVDFPRAVVAQHRHKAPLLDVQVHPVQRQPGARPPPRCRQKRRSSALMIVLIHKYLSFSRDASARAAYSAAPSARWRRRAGPGRVSVTGSPSSSALQRVRRSVLETRSSRR